MPTPKAHKLYRRAINRNLAPYYANWLPGTPQKLGNYGVFNQGSFVTIGNIKDDFGIDFEVLEDPAPQDAEFNAGGNVSVSYDTTVAVDGLVNGSLKLTFERDNSVYFQTVGARANRIKNKLSVGDRILEGMKDGSIDWKRRYILITDIVTGGRTVAAVSSESGAEIEFSAAGNVPGSEIPIDASIALSVKKSNKIGYNVNSHGMDILLGLSKVKRRFFNPVFAGLAHIVGPQDMPLANSPQLPGQEDGIDNLTFGQLSATDLLSELDLIFEE